MHILDRHYEAMPTTRSQNVSFVNLICCGRGLGLLNCLSAIGTAHPVTRQVGHTAGHGGGREIQVHLGKQVGLAAGLLEVRRQRGCAPLDHLQPRVLLLQRPLLLE